MTSSYPPDLAGDFASDVHRRVLAAVPTPGETERSVYERVIGDVVLDLGDAEVDEILKDLEADGHVKQLKDGDWRHTKEGYELLTAPPKAERERQEALDAED